MLLRFVLLLTLILIVRTSEISGYNSLLFDDSTENDTLPLRSKKASLAHFLLPKTTATASPQTRTTNPHLQLKGRQFYRLKQAYNPSIPQPPNLQEQLAANQPALLSYGWNLPPRNMHSGPSYKARGMSNYWASSQPLTYWVSYPTVQAYRNTESHYGVEGYNAFSQSNNWMNPHYQPATVQLAYVSNAFTDMAYQWRPPTQTEQLPNQFKPWPPATFSQPVLPKPTPSGWMDFNEFVLPVEAEHLDSDEVDSSHDVAIISDGFCAYPFMQLDRGCYYFSASDGATVRDWFSANNKCIAMKGHLAKMETLFISDILKLYVTTKEWFSQRWYIGLKESSYDEWQWADGLGKISTRADFLLWCESEPKIGGRKCASWQPIAPSHSRFCWRSEPCAHSLMDMHFICQKPIINGTQQKRLVHGETFWRHEFWMPGYVDVIAEYGNIVPIK